MMKKKQIYQDYQKSNSSVTYQGLSSELNLSVASIKRHILYLKSNGIIERVGSTRSRHWHLK